MEEMSFGASSGQNHKKEAERKRKEREEEERLSALAANELSQQYSQTRMEDMFTPKGMLKREGFYENGNHTTPDSLPKEDHLVRFAQNDKGELVREDVYLSDGGVSTSRAIYSSALNEALRGSGMNLERWIDSTDKFESKMRVAHKFSGSTQEQNTMEALGFFSALKNHGLEDRIKKVRDAEISIDASATA